MAASAEFEFEVIEKETAEFSFTDCIDTKREEQLITEFVGLGLEESDPNHWHLHKKTDKVQVDYKISKQEQIYTVRCQTVMSNADMADYYKFCESSANRMSYLNSFMGDAQTSMVQTIDENHSVLYSCIKPGALNSYLVAPRDFCYIQTRFALEDYKEPISDIVADAQHPETKEDEVYDYVVGSFCYQNNNHPYYVNEVGQNQIRGRLLRSGYILAQLDYDSFRVVNIFCCDWSGKMPYWYLNNFVASYSAEKISNFHREWHDKVVKAIEDEQETDSDLE
mmetsp:Transcript_17699/g.28294  ORF Transcript_17699/g.28294 Transcript_17699/m.28294 type:complete len:280 (+) Transcript_17699:30-869(+)